MIYAIVFFAVVIFDQLSKAFVEAHSASLSLFGGWLKITNGTRNSGMAFSMLADKPWAQAFFVVSTVCVLAAFTSYLIFSKNKNPFFRTGIVFIMGGAVGNLIDRLAFKAVRDFIFVQNYSTFNVADSFICIGATMMIIYYLFVAEDALFRKKKNESDIDS
ncbi:MAG: signal peptidase II [Christensenellaceae bacterium]